MTHKILHGNCPDNLQNKFTRRSQISSYSTRNSHNLHLPKPRLEFTKKSFQFTGATAWNEIPQKYRDLPSLNGFKKEVNNSSGAEVGESVLVFLASRCFWDGAFRVIVRSVLDQSGPVRCRLSGGVAGLWGAGHIHLTQWQLKHDPQGRTAH